MREIIYITPDAFVISQQYFTFAHGQTIQDPNGLPMLARYALGIKAPIVVRAWWHPSTTTWAFAYNFTAWHVIGPVVLHAVAGHPHWKECKACRDENWCAVGQGLINMALGEEQMA